MMAERRWKDSIARRYAYGAQRLTRDAEFLGSGYGGWWVCSHGVARDDVVYSFGVGEDVSFDIALIERHDVRVFAFDPTPRAVRWIATRQLPARFSFEAVGIAAFDGTAMFAPPADDTHASYRLAPPGSRSAAVAGTVKAPVRRLATLMREHGHDELALLKMDIEGAEYDVIDDLVASGLPVRQLLVEFHPGRGLLGWRSTRNAVRALRNAGFDVARVSERGREVTFVRRTG